MLDESSCCSLVEGHRPLLGLGFQGLDFFKILFHAGQFPEHGMLLCVNTMKSDVGWRLVSEKVYSVPNGDGIQKIKDSSV